MGEGILLVIVVVLALVFGVSSRGETQPASPLSPPSTVLPISQGQPLTRQTMEEALRQLGESVPPDPKSLSVGAMCYDMEMSQESGSFLCPKCNTKTFVEAWIASQIAEAEAMVASMTSLQGKLDCSGFCAKCNPPAPGNEPRFILHITYPDDRSEVVSPVTTQELKILQQFLRGSDRFTGETGQESAMKDYLPRIEEILRGKKK